MAGPVNDVMVFHLAQPARWINANDRIHYRRKADLTAAWRLAAKEAALQHGGWFGSDAPVHIAMWVHKTTNRKYDVNNLQPTAKAIVDGLVSAGVIVNDDNEHVIGPDMREGFKLSEPAVTVRIRRATKEDMESCPS